MTFFDRKPGKSPTILASHVATIKPRRAHLRRTHSLRMHRFECLETRSMMAADTISQATLLGIVSTTPVSISDTLSPDTDVDIYGFSVFASQTVTFNINTPQNGPGGLGSYLRLFNSEGTQLAFNDDAAGPGETLGFDAFLSHSFAAAGTYYLGVSNNNNILYNPISGAGDTSGGLHTTGAYQLVLQGAPLDLDSTFVSANELGAIRTTPIITSASINPDTDVDMYRFTVNAGQVIDFDINTPQNGPGGLGSYIRLFNASGTQLATNDDAAAPGETPGFDAYLRHTFPLGGTYYLGVSNLNNNLYNPVTGNGDTSGGPHTTGTYDLVIQAIVPPPVDNDDTFLEANIIGIVSTTPYTRSDNIIVDVDVDMYMLVANAGQTVDFNINTALNGPNGLGSYLRLFNSSGTQLAFNDDAAAPGETLGFDAYLRYTFTTAGTYYLGVSNLNNDRYDPLTGDGDASGGRYSTGSYQLIVQALLTDTDDRFATANIVGAVLASPQTFNAGINPDIDVDLYRFTVVAGQLVDFNINTPLNGPGGLGSYLRLFDTIGTELASNDDAAAPRETLGFDAYLRHTFPTAGIYYLGVSNHNNRLYNPITGAGDTRGGLHATGTYELVIQGNVVFPANDPDDTLSEAIPVGGITSVTPPRGGNITADTDVDMYAITVVAGQTIDFNINTPLNRPNGLGSYIRVFNALGNQLAFNDDAPAPGETIGFDSYLRYTFASGGIYYLGVSSFYNTLYDPITGNGDAGGGLYSTGTYELAIRAPISENAPLHNFVLSADVNNDGNVTALDALAVINYLNQIDAGQSPITVGPPFLDVNADRNVTASDALEVIIALNRIARPAFNGPVAEDVAVGIIGVIDQLFKNPTLDFLDDLSVDSIDMPIAS